MRPVLKWSFRILGIAGVAAAIGLGLYISFAPGFAERKILAALRGMGIDDASVEVRSVGASHLQITNLNLGDGAGLTVGAVGVDYSISPAGGLRIKTIDIVGARLDLRLSDGKLDLGPLGDIKTGEGQSMADDPVPFDLLRLRAGSVLVEWRGRRFALPVDVTLTHKGKGECDALAVVTLLGVQVGFKGTIDFTAPPMPPDGTMPSADPLKAAGIRFQLATADLGQPIEIQGWINGEAGNMNIAVSTGSGDAAADAISATAMLTRNTQETSLTIKASGRPAKSRHALPGLSLETEKADVLFDARIDLNTGTIDGSLALRAGSLIALGGGRTVTLTEPAIKARLSGSWNDQAVTLALGKDTAFAFKDAVMTGGKDELRAGGAAITLDTGRFILPLASGGTEPGVQIALHSSPLDVRMGASRLTLDGFESRIDLSLNRENEPTLAGSVKVHNAGFENSDAAVQFAGITAEVPFTLGRPRAAGVGDGFEVKAVRWNQDTFAAMKGTLAVDHGVLKVDINWPVFDEAPIKVAGSVDLLNGFAGRIKASVHDLRITDEQAVAKRLKAAEPFRVTGTFDLDADLTIAGGVIAPRIVVAATDASFTAGKLDFVATGINTTLTLDSLSPLRTLPNQRLAIREGHLGKLAYRNAIINFRLDAIDALAVELAAWSVGERGRFWVHAARFNPAAPVLETQVFIDDMSVAEWLEIIQDGKVAGEGWLYGRIPMRVDQASEFVLTFGEGFLYAKPGKGWVRLSSRDTTPQQIYKTLEEAIANLAREAQERLLAAVMDFEFDTLKFDFIREDKGVLCRIATTGRGRTGLKQEVGGLTVNIHNFGTLLSRQLLRGTDSVGAIDDAIRRALEGK
jgi:hypothetical protein